MKYFALFSFALLSIFALTSCENEVPIGKLIVTALPGDYEIIIDNESTGFSTPHTFMLPMGVHSVLVVSDGLEFSPAIEEIVIDTSPLAIEFKQMDTLHVDSNPQGAEITINSRANLDLPILTPATLELPVGDYIISVTTYGYSTETSEVTLIGDGSASISF
ncbi:PEGA domain-containing protein, partial [bacterium]|nr:PEGA domain-containing protein [bacterium]